MTCLIYSSNVDALVRTTSVIHMGGRGGTPSKKEFVVKSVSPRRSTAHFRKKGSRTRFDCNITRRGRLWSRQIYSAHNWSFSYDSVIERHLTQIRDRSRCIRCAYCFQKFIASDWVERIVQISESRARVRDKIHWYISMNIVDLQHLAILSRFILDFISCANSLSRIFPLNKSSLSRFTSILTSRSTKYTCCKYLLFHEVTYLNKSDHSIE